MTDSTAKTRKLPGSLVGVAGEHFVAAELSRRGYVASITLRNPNGIDILVSNANASKSAGIQVKAKQGKSRDWILRDKAEQFFSATLFYVFVNLKDRDSRPDFFVVPSKVVAAHAKKYHALWLSTPGKKEQQHKDNPMRKFHDKEGEYLERWDLLGL